MLNKIRPVHLWAPAFGGFGGGIAAFSRQLASGLITVAPMSRLFLYGKADVSGKLAGTPLTGVGNWPVRLRTFAFGVLLAAATLRDRPSLIVSTHLNFGPVARAIRAVLGVPYVLVAHGIDVHTGLSQARLTALRSANAVWAVSKWTRQRLLDIGVSAERIQVVPNTVSEHDFTIGSAEPALRDRYGLQPDEKVVLTVARVEAGEGYKGYDKVLRALPAVCEAVGKVRYLVVGKGNDAERLTRMAGEMGVADRLTLCGFVPDRELAAHYRLADVFAMPSLGEGFGIVFLEAMACGIPVLAGNRDGSVDALADGEFGRLVNPDDVGDIAKGLVDLLQRRGPALWFDRSALRQACLERYGRSAFRAKLSAALALLSSPAR